MSADVRGLPDAAIRVSALCLACKPHGGLAVTTDGSNRCPRCGTETPLESRGGRRIVDLVALEAAPAQRENGARHTPALAPAASPPSPPLASDPILLPALTESAAWYDQTAALFARLGQEEAEAVEALRVAQERVTTARRARAAIDKVLGFVTVDVDDEAMSSAVDGQRGLPVVRARPSRALPAPETAEPDPERWHHRYRGGCKDRGTTTTPHALRGAAGHVHRSAGPASREAEHEPADSRRLPAPAATVERGRAQRARPHLRVHPEPHPRHRVGGVRLVWLPVRPRPRQGAGLRPARGDTVIGRGRPPGGRGLLQRVYRAMFGPGVPEADSELHRTDRIWMTAALLAEDLAAWPDLGFPGSTAVELLPIAERWVFMRWLADTGRLADDQAAEAGAGAGMTKERM